MSGLDQASLIVRRGRSGHRERSLCRTAVALVFVAVFASAAAAQNNPAPNNQTCGRPANALAPITVVPAVIQPDAIVCLALSKDSSVASVKLDNVDVPFVATSTKEIKLKVPTAIEPGRHAISVELTPPQTTTAAAGATATAATELKSPVIVAPLILGLKRNKQADIYLSRVVVPGGDVILQFKDKIPAEIRESLKVNLEQTVSDEDRAKGVKPDVKSVHFSIPEDNYLVLEVPEDLARTTYSVDVLADDVLLPEKPIRIRTEPVSHMYWRSSLILAVLILFLYLLYKLFYRVPEGQPRYTFLTMLMLEQENQTYSLSRAQFLGWMTVIIWSYLFLYYAHGFIEQDWSYPNLGNSIYAFMISLGTLVASQAASSSQGVKGAGEVHPSLADLVVHGGVLALDRVQQVVWTLIALGMFIRITVSTYATSSALPDIPPELLGLMGLSAVGYLGGKLVRGAGPVIQQVTVTAGSVILNIRGLHISKDAFFWLDGVQQAKEKITVKADDPDDPLKFAKEIEITLDITLDDWYSKDHAITVVNTDAQRADWHTSAEIIGVTHEPADTPDKVKLTIKTARANKGATVDLTGADDVKTGQDNTDPNLFTAVVDAAWITQPHELILTSGGKKSTFTFTP